MNQTYRDLLTAQSALNDMGAQVAADDPLRPALAHLATAIDALLAEQAVIIARLMHANDRLYTVAQRIADDNPLKELLVEALNDVRWSLYPELADELLMANGADLPGEVRQGRAKVATTNQAQAKGHHVVDELAARLQRDALELAARVRLSKLQRDEPKL
ncbi:MAG TPA: hypothetical protein DCS21_10695 [Gammaproteobacteria bacterium]|nr:hypothetical protein [Gammaproteobacteria bacterium]